MTKAEWVPHIAQANITVQAAAPRILLMARTTAAHPGLARGGAMRMAETSQPTQAPHHRGAGHKTRGLAPVVTVSQGTTGWGLEPKWLRPPLFEGPPGCEAYCFSM